MSERRPTSRNERERRPPTSRDERERRPTARDERERPTHAPEGKLGVVVLNFGEPSSRADAPEVEDYLERIFLQNRALEELDAAAADSAASRSAGAARARQLARARAPTLMETYRLMGDSPLNAQADAQASALEWALRSRGWDARTYSAFQFTSPSVEAQVARACVDGVESLVALPVYPLCGRSTTVAALDSVERAIHALAWRPRFSGIAGWHHHPSYLSLRVDGVRAYLARNLLDIRDADTLLYFSVHGTPVKYLDEGNRYDRYVEEHCRDVARALGAERYAVGFQNHTNRSVDWTRPDNEVRIREAPERRLVVVPISFMHEQSETLAELDLELRAYTEGLGKQFHRVPVPHDDPRFAHLLADLVTEALAPVARKAPILTSCGCRRGQGTWCTNGDRTLPPSPYVRAAAG